MFLSLVCSMTLMCPMDFWLCPLFLALLCYCLAVVLGLLLPSSCLAAALGLLCPSCLVEIHVSPISLEMGPTKRGMIQIYLEEIT